MHTVNKIIVTITVVASMLVAHSCSREPGAVTSAVVQSAVGTVSVITGTLKRTPRPGDILAENDGILTGKASMMDMLLGDITVIRVYENTSAKLSALTGPAPYGGRFKLDTGKIFVIISKLRKGDSFRVITPTTTIAVRGTAFRVTGAGNNVSLAVLTGKAELRVLEKGGETGDAIIVERNSAADISSALAESIAAGKARVPVRMLSPAESQALADDFLAIKTGTIDRLPAPVREGFQADIDGVNELRGHGLRESRDRALRESLLAKEKAEREALEKKKMEEAEKKKKDDEARAKAIRDRKQQRPDRSGDVSGSR
jgi:hypothetical protein